MMNEIIFEKPTTRLIIITGVLISVFQLIFNRSLWLDEAYLSLNIILKSYFELLKPLDFQQVAPILFLQIEKLLSQLIPHSEYGLRLFPVMCFILSLVLFYRILKLINQNDRMVIFSLSLFVFNPKMIYYSSEVKQYMTDLFVLTVIYYLALKNYKKEEYKYYLLGIIGVVSIYLSNVSPIILFSCGVYLLYDHIMNKKIHFKYIVGVAFIWLISFLLYYYFFIFGHPSKILMLIEWENYGAFMPSNPLSMEFYHFLFKKGSMIVLSLFSFGIIGGVSLSVLILAGLLYIIRERKIDIIILTLTPLILHLLLSSFKLYPFDERLILYACPCFIILSSFGIYYLAEVLSRYMKIEKIRLLVVIFPLMMFAYFLYQVEYPMERNEIKKSLIFIKQNMNNNDTVYVNYSSRVPFLYYHYVSFSEMEHNKVFIGQRTMFWNGNKWSADRIKFSDDLNILKGRVWFLFTSVTDEPEKNKFLIDYYNAKGLNLAHEFHAKGSDVYLYDIRN